MTTAAGLRQLVADHGGAVFRKEGGGCRLIEPASPNMLTGTQPLAVLWQVVVLLASRPWRKRDCRV